MKKLVFLLLLCVSGASQAAVPLLSLPAVIFIQGVVIGHEWNKPVPAYLTDACKEETVKAKDGNYSYTNYEHCQKAVPTE